MTRQRIRKVEVLRVPERSPYWYVRWYELKPDGRSWKERWRSSKSDKKRVAESMRRQIERELDAGKRLDADTPFQDVRDEFLEKHAKNKRGATAEAYRKSLKMFETTANPKTMGHITVGLLEDFRNARTSGDDGVAPETANRDLRHVRAFLKWAARRQYIQSAPDFHGLFLATDKKQPTIIPEADFLAIIRALKTIDDSEMVRKRDWWNAWLYVAYYAGLRFSEIMGLEWRSIRNEPPGVLVSAESSKGRKDRLVPIQPAIAKILADWRATQPTMKLDGTDRVFPWPDEFSTYRDMYHDWHAIQKAASIPDDGHYVPHDLRRSFCSELIRSGAATATVKDLAGHRSILTTERYYIDSTPSQRSAIQSRSVAIAV